MTKRILTGSRAFFSAMEGFRPKDTDIIVLVDKGYGFKYVHHIIQGKTCLFIWVKRPKKDLMDYALKHGAPMQVIKFLTPQFAAEIGMEVSDLHKLRPLIDRLDEKHSYARIIFESYLSNDAFSLSEEQLETAYASYKSSRL